jgi:hypothetical protein
LGRLRVMATYLVNKRAVAKAAEWEHTEVMRAAHNLLLYLDESRT